MSERADLSASDVYRHMARGSAWAIAMRWAIRGIGLVSFPILARLLTPADFGIVAIATMLTGFLGVFAEFGAQALLIREQDATREHIDTAWTIKLLQGALVALVLLAVAPLAAAYFDEPRATAVISTFAGVAILDGAVNIGITLARKELDFALDFRFNVYGRLVKFVVTIALAFALRSYWAIVYATVVSAVIGVLLSYAMHPYRPRPCLARYREYFDFALAVVPMRIGNYLNGAAPTFIVGGLASTAEMGLYNVGAQLSRMMTAEIVVPIGRAMLPNYAKLSGGSSELATAFAQVLAATCVLFLPVGFGLWAVAPDFVLVMLGHNWSASVPIIRWIAVAATLDLANIMMTSQVLVAAGHERRSAVVTWIRLALLVPAAIIGGTRWGIEGVAAAVLVVSIAMTPVSLRTITNSIPLSYVMIARAVWRPALATALMLAAVEALPSGGAWPAALRLASEAALGAGVYATSLAAAWLVAGRPPGLESVVHRLVRERIRHRPAA